MTTRPPTGSAAPTGAAPATGVEQRRHDVAIACGLALALVAIYTANGDILTTNDATPNVYTTVNVLQEGRASFTPSRDPALFDWNIQPGREIAATLRLLDLDTEIEGHSARQLRAAGILVPEPGYWLAPSTRSDLATHEPLYVSTFGPGAALMALPVLATIRPFAGDLRQSSAALWYGGKLAASVFVALSAAVIYLASRRWLGRAPAALLALAYGLGTGVWSTSSQTLWQHAPTELFLALGAYGLVRARESGPASALAGASFAIATACRPTSAVFELVAAAYLAITQRRALVTFAIGAAPFALALGAYNAWYFGSPFRFGQTVVGDALALGATGIADQWQTPLWEGVPGVLVSPSRGLFVFSPFLLASIPGAVASWRREEYSALRPLTVAAVVLVAVAGKHYDWWGGWAYGYRHVVDLAPALVLLLVPIFGEILRSTPKRLAFAGLLAWSVGVQVIGAFAYDTAGWNAQLAYRVALRSGETKLLDADHAAQIVREGGAVLLGTERMEIANPAWRHRLWSLRDNQIGYYLTHFQAARQARREQTRTWIEWWRLPASQRESRS